MDDSLIVSSPVAENDTIGVRRNYLEMALLFLICLAGMLIRLWQINRTMDYDETFSFLYYINHPLRASLSNYSLPNNQLFHAFLSHLSIRLFGHQPWAIRIPAFIAGVAIIPATYLLTKRFFQSSAGLLAAALMAGMTLLVDYSTNARGYTLIVLLFIGVMLCADRVHEKHDWASWSGFAVISTLAIYTIPSMVCAIAGVLAWLLAEYYLGERSLPRKQFLTGFFLAALSIGLLTFLLYLPALLNPNFNSVVNSSVFQWSSFKSTIVGAAESLFLAWKEWFLPVYLPHVYLLAGGVLACFAGYRRLAKHRVPIILPLIIVAMLFFITLRAIPYTRLWMFLIPIYVAMASSGLCWAVDLISPRSKVLKQWCIPLLVCALLSCCVVKFWYWIEGKQHAPESDDKIAQFMMTNLAQNDIFGAQGVDAMVFNYYFKMHGIRTKQCGGRCMELEFWRVIPDIPATTLISTPLHQRYLVMLNDLDRAGFAAYLTHMQQDFSTKITTKTIKKIGTYDFVEYVINYDSSYRYNTLTPF